MCRALRVAALLPLFVLMPALAQDKDAKDAKDPADAAKEAEAKYRAKLVGARFFYGKLTAIDAEGDEKKFTVTVPFKNKTVNAEGMKKYNEVLQRYRAAYIRRDAAQVQQIYPELTEAYNGAYDVTESDLEFLLVAGKDLMVRKPTLPPKEPGDDGITRPYTAKELAALKGSPILPGWTATAKELEQDGYVAVYIDRAKYKPAPMKTAKDKAKEKEKTETDKDEPVLYPINMLVILPPPDDGNPFGKDAKK
jgi:hypothetical protein